METDLTRVAVLDEPELEFGQGGRHVDLRTGLTLHGPLADPNATAEELGPLRISVIGTGQTIADATTWLQKMARDGAPAKPSRLSNLFMPFPGTGRDSGFRREFQFDGAMGEIMQRNLLLPEKATREQLLSTIDEIGAVAQQVCDRRRAEVVVVALPAEYLNAISDEHHPRFRGIVKARLMTVCRAPIQLLLPTTYNAGRAAKQKKRPHLIKQLQDEATRAWNIFTALYYKAGGTPWRVPRRTSDYTSCAIGISFFESEDGSAMHSSMAQIFDERGVGSVVRGAEAVVEKSDRRPYLRAEDAHSLLEDALKSYLRMHRTMPARVTIHKSSEFRPSEIEGFRQAALDNRVQMLEMIWIGNTGIRLFREGKYPPLRGTVWRLDDDRLLFYTRGSVQFFQTYPGMYVPNPLLVRIQQAERPDDEILREILALTKMNWNNTQFDNRSPITLKASRSVGDVLKHLPPGAPVAHEYRYYM